MLADTLEGVGGKETSTAIDKDVDTNTETSSHFDIDSDTDAHPINGNKEHLN